MASKFVASIQKLLIIITPIVLVSALFGNFFLHSKVVSTNLEKTDKKINYGIISKGLENTEENRLKQYYLISQIYPLLSIPEQIGQIGEIDKTILNISKLENFNGKLGTKHAIFPLSFLQQYTILIRKQSDFFENSLSKESAIEYQNQLEKTIAEYTTSLGYYKNLIQANFRDKMDKKNINTSGGYYITPALVYKDMELMEKNASKLLGLIQERRICLEKDIGSCNGGDIDSGLSEEPSKKTDAPTNASKTWISAKTGCWNEDRASVVTFGTICKDFLGFCYLEGKIKDKIFYKIISPDLPYESVLFKEGVRVNPLNILAPYMCSNNGYKATLGNLDYYIDYIQKNTLSKNGTHDTDFLALVSEEKILIQDNGSDTERLKRISDLYLNYILKNRDSLNDKAIQDILIRYRLLKGNFMNNYLAFNESLMHIMNYFATIVASKKSLSDDGINYVILTRSNFSFNFLTFSPFLWKIKEFPTFLMNLQSANIQMDSKSLDEAAAIKIYGKESIDKWNDIFYTINKSKFYSQYYKNVGF